MKDGPGGFQDYVTARWLAAMSAMEKQGGWPDPERIFFSRDPNRDGFGAGFLRVRALLSAFPE